MRKRFINGDGFSLVEVMLALAIVSIGLIAILGLLPTGLRSARDAADNTISATVIQDVFSTIRSSPFTAVDLNNPYGFPPSGGPLPTYNLQNNYPSITAYFDQAGFSNPLQQDRYYQVNVTLTNQAPLALSVVTATVVWPAHSKNPVNTNVFVTQVAQYQ